MLGEYGTKVVEVFTDNPLSILLEKVNHIGKKTKLIFKGMTFMVNSKSTFKEIGMDKDSTVFFFEQAISGGKIKESNKYENLSD